MDSEKGFFAVNGKAYSTFNNGLVYNVRIRPLCKKITKDEILNYFKKFGKIKDVLILRNLCDIKFFHPEDALKCLNGNHTINGRCVNVYACHSWYQPRALMENNAPGDNHTVDRTDNASILKLDDDCLEIIFKKLYPLDQLNLALTCRRLTNVFVTLSRIEYKTINSDLFDCLTLCKTRPFLQMIGSQINNVNFDGCDDSDIPKLLGKFCTNLKKLTIMNVNLTTHIVTKILSRNVSITQLKLHNANLSDDCISIISKMPALKSLSLYGNYEISGRYIKDLINLESLCLNRCKSVEPCHFKEIYENLKALKILKIRNCPKLLNEITYENIVIHLSELETLHINFYIEHVMHRLAELPKLKHLQLHEDYFTNSQYPMVPELAVHLGNQLETLCVDSCELTLLDFTHIAQLKKLKTLMCPNNTCLNDECLQTLAVLQDLEVINLNNCKGFTGEGVLDLIKSCGKLRVIHLLCSVVLGDSFTSEVLNVYKNRSTKPLTIWKFKPNDNRILLKIWMLLFDGNNFSENFTSPEKYMFNGETGDEDNVGNPRFFYDFNLW